MNNSDMKQYVDAEFICNLFAVSQDIACSLSKSDSIIHRKVQLAKTKLLNHFSICKDDQVQS